MATKQGGSLRLAVLAMAALAAAGGARAEVPPAGLSIEAGYIGDLFHVARGGPDTGTRYLDNLYVTIAVQDALVVVLRFQVSWAAAGG